MKCDRRCFLSENAKKPPDNKKIGGFQSRGSDDAQIQMEGRK